METQPSEDTSINNQYMVDSSRPFRSVKEAISIFGELFLHNEINSSDQKPCTSPKRETKRTTFLQLSPASPPLSNHRLAMDDESSLANALKKLEAELEETKRELKSLKEKESETVIALASLNAELHDNMSKLAEAEAAASGKAVTGERGCRRDGISKEEITKDPIPRMEYSSSLAEVLSVLDQEGYFGISKEQRKMLKKKPIIPLVGDLLFSRKKSSSTTNHYPPYAASQAYHS
ncbi:PREDICTED: WEB family protein At3g51220-like [Nelumbo nucifera]|uniref:WEB family protein At3g51220 n=2 Tax=Nelumbo nucifera TaxID=4432 RepID=A0A822ZCJ4_NELNU|nr:PREDICTED: WEB family protein At3g51220-like [Nelumbo nucifera]DAD39258.1 TPA_asm: hypothetical protein HUJ06_013581 [Nelumbo nucifera]